MRRAARMVRYDQGMIRIPDRLEDPPERQCNAIATNATAGIAIDSKSLRV
jgi:hypothetical protein